MRHLKLGAAIVIFILTLTLGLQAQVTQQSTPGQARVFQITADNYHFNPFTVIVNQGDKVRLVITAGDRDYEFRLKAYDIKEKLSQGVPTTIELTATKAGKFTFSSPGLVHRTMKGTLVVKGLSTKEGKKKK